MKICENLLTLLCLLGAHTMACGPEESALIVSVIGRPAEADRLIVETTFAGEPGRTESVKPVPEVFSIRVPKQRAGTAILKVKVEDASGCRIAEGSTMTEFAGHRLEIKEDVRLELTASAKSWALVPSPTTQEIRAVWGSGSNDVWAVGYSPTAGPCTILRWNGAVWTLLSSPCGPMTVTLNSVWGSGPSDVWAVGGTPGPGGLFVHYDGTQWTRFPDIGSDFLRAVWGSGPNDVWALGDQGRQIRYTSGPNWMNRTTSINGHRYGVWGSGPNDIWAVGNGDHYHWQGSNWAPNFLTTAKIYSAVWGSNASDVWAVTDDGRVSHWDGTLWTVPAQAATVPLNGVWGTSSTDVWIVGDNGTILHGTGIGTWSQVSSMTSASLRSVWGSSACDVWAVGGSGTILHYQSQ